MLIKPVFDFRLIILLTGLTACGPGEDERPSNRPDSPFFDLRAYVQDQIDRLQEEQPRVSKTVALDGRTETLQPDSLNYQDELRVFLNSDINRVAWWEKYSIDSTLADGNLRSIRYSARDSSLQIRSLVIEFEHDQVSRIFVDGRSDSPTADLRQQLRYDPKAGYRIHTRQEVVFSPPREMEIVVEWSSN